MLSMALITRLFIKFFVSYLSVKQVNQHTISRKKIAPIVQCMYVHKSGTATPSLTL